LCSNLSLTPYVDCGMAMALGCSNPADLDK
jgi:hypothetical protein